MALESNSNIQIDRHICYSECYQADIPILLLVTEFKSHVGHVQTYGEKMCKKNNPINVHNTHIVGVLCISTHTNLTCHGSLNTGQCSHRASLQYLVYSDYITTTPPPLSR